MNSKKFMPFEIIFNKLPNVGNKKEFVECNKNGEEVAMEECSKSNSATTSKESEKNLNDVDSEKECDNDEIERCDNDECF